MKVCSTDAHICRDSFQVQRISTSDQKSSISDAKKNKAILSNFMKICKIQFLGANNSFCFCPAFGGDCPKVSGGCVIQDSIFCHTNTTEL